MSIGTRILLVVALLGSGLALLLGLNARSAYDDSIVAGEQQRLNEISGFLISASAQLASERGLINGQLVAPTQTPDAIKAQIMARRSAAQAALAAASTRLSTEDLRLLAPSGTALDALRARIDRAFAGQEPAPPSGVWFAAATAAIDAVVNVRRQADARGGTQNQTQLLVLARDRLAEVAEFAGRERGTLNGLIAANAKVSPGQLYGLGGVSGRIDSAWAMVGPATVLLPASVQKPLAHAAQAWNDVFAPVRRQVLDAARSGEPWPMAQDKWFTTASVAIDTVLAAQAAVTAEIDARLTAEGAALRRSVWLTGASLLLAIALSGGLALYVRRGVLRPLTRIIATMVELASGRLDIALPEARGRHEIAKLIRATAQFRETACQARAMAMAQDEMRVAAETSRRDAMREIGDIVASVSDQAVAGVSKLTVHLQTVANDVHGSAEALAEGSRQTENDANQAQRSSVVAMDAARELTSAIGEIAQQMERAAGSTREAVGRTRETENVFATLSGHVTEVGEVARLIAEIAGRTNLLALNATIEAARAGEAGRGFAVVAGEVKILAQETERSTARISQRISAIEDSTRAAVAAVGGITASITEIDAVAAMVAAAVEQQAASTAGIAEAVGQLSHAAGRVATRMQEMSQGASDCESGSGRLAFISSDVNSQVSGVKNTLIGLMCARVAEIDRRSQQRVSVKVAAVLKQGAVSMSGQIVDISTSGARFVCATPGAWNETVPVRLLADGMPEFKASIVRSDQLLVQLKFVPGTEACKTACKTFQIPGVNSVQ